MLYNNGKGKGVTQYANPIQNSLYNQGYEFPATPPLPPDDYFWIDNNQNNLVTDTGDFLIFNVS